LRKFNIKLIACQDGRFDFYWVCLPHDVALVKSYGEHTARIASQNASTQCIFNFFTIGAVETGFKPLLGESKIC